MTKVKICGVPYTIARGADKYGVDHDDNGDELWGQISYSRHSIRFLGSSPEQEMRTILHEILHGVIEGNDIRELKSPRGGHFEAPINQLANGLAEALESLGFKLPVFK